MAAYWWAVAIIIVGIIGGFLYYLKTPDGKKRMGPDKNQPSDSGKAFPLHIYCPIFGKSGSASCRGYSDNPGNYHCQFGYQ